MLGIPDGHVHFDLLSRNLSHLSKGLRPNKQDYVSQKLVFCLPSTMSMLEAGAEVGGHQLQVEEELIGS